MHVACDAVSHAQRTVPLNTVQKINQLGLIMNWEGRKINLQGGSNMTGTVLCVNKPYCAAAVRP